jgi:tRNA-5-methyluridine54 2-sulfurtransferase
MNRCRKCQAPATVFLARHHVTLCAEHFLEYVQKIVKKTIKKYKMINPYEKVAVAVSGGKDSAVLLQVLDAIYGETLELVGLQVDLGIDAQDYSKKSLDRARDLCQKLHREFVVVDLKKDYQISMDLVKEREARLKRPYCAVCGTFKRYLLNRSSLNLGCEKLATGHLLDDEVSVLLMNIINGNMDQLVRAGPKLEGNNSTMIARIKPLYEVSELETTLYAQIKGFGFQDGECPYSVGASTTTYKNFFHNIEDNYPGTTIKFLQNYHKVLLPPLKISYQRAQPITLNRCKTCDGPTTEEICAFCNIRYLLTTNE